MTIPTLETERLRLRPFREEDAVALHRIVSAEGMLKYFPGPPSPSPERSERLVRHQIEQWTTVGYAWWAVELKATGQLAGWNGLQYLPDTQETELGFLIDRALWDRASPPKRDASDSSTGSASSGCARSSHSPTPRTAPRAASSRNSECSSIG
jgi:RimJ/RimL family protein N-acetyltransferase